uniref:Chemokine interleukin-8-like domain-containing protein n=1 Tax=Strix occidentalis caurina TaxID=311401 RepID=A0A8D0EQJ0_STROC
MKVPAATLAILLVMATCSSAHLLPSESKVTSCCVSYVSRIIPRGAISSTYMTSNMCSLPGVILVTRKGKELCADPKAPWVQEHVKHFQTLEN